MQKPMCGGWQLDSVTIDQERHDFSPSDQMRRWRSEVPIDPTDAAVSPLRLEFSALPPLQALPPLPWPWPTELSTNRASVRALRDHRQKTS